VSQFGDVYCQKIDRILALRAMNEKNPASAGFFLQQLCPRADALNNPPGNCASPHESYTQALY
jgi:hypothetical protein